MAWVVLIEYTDWLPAQEAGLGSQQPREFKGSYHSLDVVLGLVRDALSESTVKAVKVFVQLNMRNM